MKKIIFIVSAVLLLASCSVNRAAVSTTYVKTPVVSATVATLEVAQKPITHTYYPSKAERKLDLDQLVANAIYEALQKNGKGDELVKVSYYVNGKRKAFRRIKVKYITVTGYPATYKNFREPNADDRANIEAVYNTNTSIKVVK